MKTSCIFHFQILKPKLLLSAKETRFFFLFQKWLTKGDLSCDKRNFLGGFERCLLTLICYWGVFFFAIYLKNKYFVSYKQIFACYFPACYAISIVVLIRNS